MKIPDISFEKQTLYSWIKIKNERHKNRKGQMAIMQYSKWWRAHTLKCTRR